MRFLLLPIYKTAQSENQDKQDKSSPSSEVTQSGCVAGFALRQIRRIKAGVMCLAGSLRAKSSNEAASSAFSMEEAAGASSSESSILRGMLAEAIRRQIQSQKRFETFFLTQLDVRTASCAMRQWQPPRPCAGPGAPEIAPRGQGVPRESAAADFGGGKIFGQFCTLPVLPVPPVQLPVQCPRMCVSSASSALPLDDAHAL